jgi:hypothetical protein
MRIEAKKADKHILRCSTGHVFEVRSLGVGVECPRCGETALAARLVTDYHLARLEALTATSPAA